ncbi:hypothetical protein M011DRAFT_247201 [Sporormia fimetaria CBS 119925]|uniref:Uncharacterized protein n=1 Tax=Sporormia fimetaria CBS 119925 TaxID=1340428 RepID=A0A6A6V0E4_9PLEO|nr:hypothetical protein M011DRAFT_247201 [Sporormia fimetaria CBS 119925]
MDVLRLSPRRDGAIDSHHARPGHSLLVGPLVGRLLRCLIETWQTSGHAKHSFAYRYVRYEAVEGYKAGAWYHFATPSSSRHPVLLQLFSSLQFAKTTCRSHFSLRNFNLLCKLFKNTFLHILYLSSNKMHVPLSTLAITVLATLTTLTSAAPHGLPHRPHRGSQNPNHNHDTDNRPPFARPTWRFGPGHSRNETDCGRGQRPSGVAPPTGGLFPTGVFPTNFPGFPVLPQPTGTGIIDLPFPVPTTPPGEEGPVTTAPPPAFSSVVPPVGSDVPVPTLPPVESDLPVPTLPPAFPPVESEIGLPGPGSTATGAESVTTIASGTSEAAQITTATITFEPLTPTEGL